MFQSDDVSEVLQLDFEAWRDSLRALCRRYNPEGAEPAAFAGWVRPGKSPSPKKFAIKSWNHSPAARRMTSYSWSSEMSG